MKFTRIAQSEERVLRDTASYNLFPFSIPFNKGVEKLEGFTCRRKDGHKNFYYNEKVKKERIVLHFTAGHLKADLATLTRRDHHVSTPFLLARNGTLLQLFSSGLWSYHLGPGCMGGNKNQSSRTIGIEITNYGILNKKGDDLHTIYSTDQRRDVYCTTADFEVYRRLDAPFRQCAFYDDFSDAQYKSLIVLIRYLTEMYDIPRAFLDVDRRYKTFPEVVNFKGIVSHVNYRPSGKWDIGPAFDWDRVIKGVKATDKSDFVSAPPPELELEMVLQSDLETTIESFSGENQVDDMLGYNQSTSEGDEEKYGPDGPGE